MSLSVAIVGLPNVGKSTLFNALLQKQQALAANYPFATIDPNVGIVQVPDQRLEKLAEAIAKKDSIAPLQNDRKLPPLVTAIIEFVDIAGLVKGASQGEGLGNQFLANIRECDLICHVLRAFENPDVILTGKLDPKDDLEVIRIELGLKDLETLEKQEKRLKKDQDIIGMQAREKAIKILSEGKMLNVGEWSDDEREWLNELNLLTIKPEIYAVNVSESRVKSQESRLEYAGLLGVDAVDVVQISAKIEAELFELPPDDKQEFLQELGLEKSGLERLAQVAYRKLDLISFLTAGEKECRAWTVKKGSNAVQASGVIHTDFMKKFIKAKVCNFDDFVNLGGWKKAAEAGKVRMEGRDYVMKDGDVVEFMIGS